MSGHSHWASIKHKKGAVDAKRGKLFSKLSRAITVAGRQGGGDPEMNLKLRYAIDAARAVSMPKDNIERAIKKGTGELEGGQLDELVYEGYGPGGVAIMAELLTDNRTRTASEVRKLMEAHNGKLGQTGCVAYLFKRKGLFTVDARTVDEEKLIEVVLESGADDAKREGDMFQVTCEPALFQKVRDALAEARIATEVAELSNIPAAPIDVDPETGRKVLKLMDALDDHEDVQHVSSNFNISEEVLAQAAAQL